MPSSRLFSQLHISTWLHSNLVMNMLYDQVYDIRNNGVLMNYM